MTLEKEFNFIKAKFIGYSNNNEQNFNNLLPEEFVDYSEAILQSRKGDLKKSLQLLNLFIVENKENYFLYETKADILMSHGYNKEALKFYKKSLNQYPQYKYAKLIIFNNLVLDNFSKEEKISSFENNLDLLFHFPHNKILYLKFLKLSIDIKKNNWLNFFNLYNTKKD